ncbi:glycerol dehydrogenase [Geobacter sp. OR-1]|uniref:glycerol dehydrogenase n=1 Tax=Geobacter sp. OR-1 TaxID=1266765 RepID=UPI0005429C55|nr:glycerol dehydrogenase [Geobacter sp. OR-1]GAM11472.1 glycerol dehydrogenase [Geobacter sp. OR-1]
MSRLFCSPGRYVQGAGAVREIGGHAGRLGRCALLVGGKTALSLCAGAIQPSLAVEAIPSHQEYFGGTSSRPEIDRLVAVAKTHGADLIIAVGGGAAIDAGKAVAHELQAPVIVVPTTVATDAPCSALAVIYCDDGSFERYLLLRRNPDCILVDTELIARAPVRFLVAGMGDALATYWESDSCARSNAPNQLTGGGSQTLATRALARICYETLLEWGVAAKLAVEQQSVTPALEAIVEANTLLSGLSSENGGHAGGHSIHNGLTTLAATRAKLHGEKVAFGVLVQLVLEGRPPEAIAELLGFCHSVGLPICLADLELTAPTIEDIRQVAKASVAEGETIHSTWFPVTADMVEAAILAADALGTGYRQRRTDRDPGTDEWLRQS